MAIEYPYWTVIKSFQNRDVNQEYPVGTLVIAQNALQEQYAEKLAHRGFIEFTGWSLDPNRIVKPEVKK